MRIEMNRHAYVHDLEQHLQLSLFGNGVADPDGAVLLVRGALAGGDQARAASLAEATQRLAADTPDDQDMAAAADHARGLIEQDPLILERAAGRYSGDFARACALEDAGNAWAEQDNQYHAEERLRQAHALYERLGETDGMARVRSCLRAVGTRLRHWRHAGAAFGCGQPDRHRAADRRSGRPGPQQPRRGEPGVPEHPHRGLSSAPRLLEARHQLPGATRPAGRRAGRAERGGPAP